MKMSDGLFLKCCREVASQFPDVQYNELIVDNACMQLVMRPETFDVLVMPNLYGDIISDLTAGLVGGLGIVPGANIGDHHAIFEAVHGTAPDIAGKGLANPTALMQSAVLMLAHLGEREASARLQSAIHEVYAEAKHLTGDVGGSASTNEFTDAIIQKLGKLLRRPSVIQPFDQAIDHLERPALISFDVFTLAYAPWRESPFYRPAQPQRPNPLMQVRPLHPQRPRRARDVPVRFLQRPQNVLALGRFARLLNGRLRPRLALHPHLHRNRVARQPLAGGQDRHALDHVAQLARIARPAVALQHREHRLVQHLRA